MPFDKERKNAERALTRIRAIVKERWGVELEVLYPALVARMGQIDYQFELTPLLRDDENGRVSLLGSQDGESLEIEGGNLYWGNNGRTLRYAYTMESALVLPVVVGGGDAAAKRTKDLAKLGESFKERARIEYLFDTIPQVLQVGLPARTYIVDFSCGDSVEAGLLRCFSFLLTANWGRMFVLGGAASGKS